MKRNGKRNGSKANGMTEIPVEIEGKVLMEILSVEFEPVVFTKEELEAIRVMCDVSIPSSVYDDVMHVVTKIDLHLGRRITLADRDAAYKARRKVQGIEPSEITRIDPAAKPEPIVMSVRCPRQHEWAATDTNTPAEGDKGFAYAGRSIYPGRCPTCGLNWKAAIPVPSR